MVLTTEYANAPEPSPSIFTLGEITYSVSSSGNEDIFFILALLPLDVVISAPGLRSRILTKVHTNGHHWIFGKNASHYSSF